LGTGSPKLELLHSCVPKLELGNKKQKICTPEQHELVWTGSKGPGSLTCPADFYP
jgi:hypothetical protein